MLQTSSVTPWPLVANGIHHYFLLATRQKFGYPERPLLNSDLEYLRLHWFEGALAMICVNIS